MTDHMAPPLQTMDLIGPVIGASIFVLLMSLIREPARQRFNAILVAGAGAAYLNGGLGIWEFAYITLATFVAYKGLSSYRFIGVAWLLHTGWDIVHHLFATPIWPWLPASSAGCAVFDAVIAAWFFLGAPSAPEAIRRRRVGHAG